MSSGDNACALRLRWWQESPVTKESAKETVKTIARGMPDCTGVTVVTISCAFLFCTRGCGRDRRARHSLRPFDVLKGGTAKQTRALAQRDREAVSMHIGLFEIGNRCPLLVLDVSRNRCSA
jgi:hypothetical protein